MKCPYCYKQTKDMPNHLIANPKCREKHNKKLSQEFSGILDSLYNKAIEGEDDKEK